LIRDRNALYRELPGDLIENVYTMKVSNMDSIGHRYRLTAPEGSGVVIELSRDLRLQAEEVSGFTVRIQLPRAAGQGVQTLPLELVAEDDPAIRKSIDARVLLPVDSN